MEKKYVRVTGRMGSVAHQEVRLDFPRQGESKGGLKGARDAGTSSYSLDDRRPWTPGEYQLAEMLQRNRPDKIT